MALTRKYLLVATTKNTYRFKPAPSEASDPTLYGDLWIDKNVFDHEPKAVEVTIAVVEAGKPVHA